MRELQYQRAGKLSWAERAEPELVEPTDALVRPFIASRCDGDTVPLHRPVSRAMQLGIAVHAIDPVVACICGRVPFRGPFAIGHECVAQIVALGAEVTGLHIGQTVIVPWAVSCGQCDRCRAGLTSKCTTTVTGELAAFGLGSACGRWGGMVSDRLRVPFAEHMLVPVPDGIPPERVAAASDNLADAWRSVVEPLRTRAGGPVRVLILGGGARSIGLYAAGLAVAHGAATIDYQDDDAERRAIAESFGARATRRAPPRGTYDVTVEATSRAAGLRAAIRALAPGGVCTAVGYYLATGTRVPLMRMYATDATLRLGVSHARALIPDLLAFIAETGFEAERVTSLTADWDDAPTAYLAKTTKVVLARDPFPAP
jgi:threonine dehydrogenase-like Zn-dependent dehydrogenase